MIRHAAAVVGKLRAYTKKELETVRAAPELLGAPTIGGGVPGPGLVVEILFIEVIYTFTAVRNSQKRRKNGRFCARFGL